jgi:hypothetical protein
VAGGSGGCGQLAGRAGLRRAGSSGAHRGERPRWGPPPAGMLAGQATCWAAGRAGHRLGCWQGRPPAGLLAGRRTSGSSGGSSMGGVDGMIACARGLEAAAHVCACAAILRCGRVSRVQGWAPPCHAWGMRCAADVAWRDAHIPSAVAALMHLCRRRRVPALQAGRQCIGSPQHCARQHATSSQHCCCRCAGVQQCAHASAHCCRCATVLRATLCAARPAPVLLHPCT